MTPEPGIEDTVIPINVAKLYDYFIVKVLWYFDEAKNQLGIHLAFIAPCIPNYDVDGVLRYLQPLFYIK